MPVEVAGADALAEQGLGPERSDDPAAEGLAGAAVAGAEVDALEPGIGPGIGERDEAVAAPDFVPRRGLRVLDPGPQLVVVGTIELRAEHTLRHLSGDPLPREPQLHPVPELPPRLSCAPDQGRGIEPRRGSSLSRPLCDSPGARPVGLPFHFRVDDHQHEAGRVRNGRTVFREGDDGKAGAALELLLDQLANGGPDLRLLVERRAPVAHDLLQGGLVMDAEAVRSDLADEEPSRLQRARGIVDARGLDLGLAEGESQLGQVGDLVHLPAGGFEEDGRAHAAMDIAERPPGIGIQRPGVRGGTREIGGDGHVEPLLAQLSEHDGAELGDVQRRRAEGDQGFRPRLLELPARRPRYPLRQHREGAAGLLELGERAPLAPEDGERRRMEGVARFETATQTFARLRLRRRAVHRHPFGGKAGGPLEAPVRTSLRDPPADSLVPEILEEPPANDLADLGLVVGDEIARDAAHDLGDPVLPLPVPVGHLHLAARQADHRRRPGGRR